MKRRREGAESRFTAFVEGLTSVIGHADRAKPLHDYCTGLVMPCERKSVEPMAAVTAPARAGAQHHSLLHFVGEAPWSDERVLGTIVRYFFSQAAKASTKARSPGGPFSIARMARPPLA
jgi:SRSO17 transposase